MNGTSWKKPLTSFKKRQTPRLSGFLRVHVVFCLVSLTLTTSLLLVVFLLSLWKSTEWTNTIFPEDVHYSSTKISVGVGVEIWRLEKQVKSLWSGYAQLQ